MEANFSRFYICSTCITDTPMGQVPVLEIDGKKYSQSKAIGRYVAKLCNLYGSNEIDALEIDGTIDALDDMRQREWKL